MYIDMYAIQTVPSSNINRDDTGSPKTAIYGGVLRSRVSSQAWKRAMRETFPSLLDESKLGVRTKFAVSLIAQRIVDLRSDLEEDAERLAVNVLEATGCKTKASDREGSDKGATSSEFLIFIARSEIEKLAELAIRWNDEGFDASKSKAQAKKDVSTVFHGAQAVDIALFGRMLANAPDLNTDASAQVAHAISVDKVVQEYDYFTAVDDCVADDNAGAGMLGTVGFNSSTLYRYATVNLDALYSQLGDARATSEGVSAFVKAFVCSMPTGKQNTFANRTLPSAVYVAFRKEQPINLVSAFEVPVRASENESVSHLAVKRLAALNGEMERAYCMPVQNSWCVLTEDLEEAVSLGVRVNLDELIEKVEEEVLETLSFKEEQ